jgi:hypothetical protein
MALGARVAVVGRISALAIGEVGWGRRLGQHSNVGNPIEACQGGVAHRRGLSAAVVARQRGPLVLSQRSGGWSQWSS